MIIDRLLRDRFGWIIIDLVIGGNINLLPPDFHKQLLIKRNKYTDV